MKPMRLIPLHEHEFYSDRALWGAAEMHHSSLVPGLPGGRLVLWRVGNRYAITIQTHSAFLAVPGLYDSHQEAAAALVLCGHAAEMDGAA